MLELRPLSDHDVPLVERWLHTGHVRKWYEVPRLGVVLDDWMTELRERDGEFAWITHLIAEWDGEPFGFCQYYRCEESGDEDFGSLELEGSYGVDYMIGEKAFLGKGHGKAMIALLVKTVLAFPDAKRVTADIDAANAASRQSLLACGFRLLDEDGSRYVLERE